MNKYFYILILISFFTSCERDDICIEETTPHLIVRSYDKLDHSKLKKMEDLQVSIENSANEFIVIGTIKSTDSIVIPLNVDLDFTKIKLSKETTDTTGVIDKFTLNYTNDEVFVSRSCGYKTIYKEVNITDLTSNWIENISIIKPTIENETAAHLTIFH